MGGPDDLQSTLRVWLRNHSIWRAAAKLGEGFKGSWLSMHRDSGIGCKACAWAQEQHGKECEAGGAADSAYTRFTVRGRSAQLVNFKRHGRSQRHQDALAAYRLHLLGRPEAAAFLLGTPSEAEFRDVWKAISLARPGHNPLSDRKRRTMEWCLSEAVRDADRAFLASASIISISMDERKGRLLVRFAACAGKGSVEVRVGVLGQLQAGGKNADELAQCVYTAVKRFCIRRRPAAGMNLVTRRATFHRGFYARILQRIEMFSADGASAEQIAARLLHPTSAREAAVKKLPSLKMILRDKAHASRRITERTFCRDPQLARLANTLLFDKDSVAKLLRFSEQFADLFAQEVDHQTRRGHAASMRSKLANLSFAKQRFDSTAKPLGRCVMNFDALLSTCRIIRGTRERGSAASITCAKFLNLIIGQPEMILLMGMMADASDECLVLTRFFDKDMFELERAPEQIADFKDRLQALFGHRRGALETGYTRVAVEHLRAQRMLDDASGKFHSIGGLGDRELERFYTTCFDKMRAWCSLVDEVLSTEFPDFELLAAFAVFRLEPSPEQSRGRVAVHSPVSAWGIRCLERLAAAFNIDRNRLVEQFQDHRRLAQREKDKQPQEPASSAWQKAVRRTRGRRGWQVDSLLPILQRFLVAPGSTSGIEHAFSAAKRALGEHWHGGPRAEERRVALLLKTQAMPDIENSILQSARLVWAQCCGPTRRPLKPSLGFHTSAWLKRKASVSVAECDRPTTEAAWLKKRRTEVANLVQSQTTGLRLACPARRAWTEQHEEEAQRQRQVRLQRACASVQEGTADLASAGVTQDDQRRYVQKEQQRQHELALRWRRQRAQQAMPETMSLWGKKVFIDASARDGATVDRWRQMRQDHGCEEVQDRCIATVFVVINPAQPGDRNKVAAAMVGGLLCSPEHVFVHSATGGAGNVLRLKRALYLPRYILVSAETSHKHKPMVDFMRRVQEMAVKTARDRGVASEMPRWRWFDHSAEHQRQFQELARKRGTSHKHEMVVLTTNDELAHLPQRCTTHAFVNKIFNVDARFTRLGLGPR